MLMSWPRTPPLVRCPVPSTRAGGIVRHENNVAVLIHLFLPPSVPLFPGIVACLAEPLQVSRMDCPFSRERSHCGQTFFQRRRIRLGFGTRDPLAGYLVLQSRGLYRDMKKASLRKLFDGADNGTRTRGLNLGKVALYQLSYVRKCFPPWWQRVEIYMKHADSANYGVSRYFPTIKRYCVMVRGAGANDAAGIPTDFAPPSASCCRMPCRSAICAPSLFALWQAPIIQPRRIRQMRREKPNVSC